MLIRTFLQAGTLVLARPLAGAEYPASLRNLRSGRTIPGEGCRDRSYIVICDDGNWLCAMSTGQGIPGEIRSFRHYNRQPTTSEAVGNFRAGM